MLSFSYGKRLKGVSVMFSTSSAPSINRIPTQFSACTALRRDFAARQPFNVLGLTGAIITVDRDAEIIAQGDAAEYCFQIVSGCVRTVRLLENGRRQVGAFLFEGDVIGWETDDEHEFAAEAVTPVILSRIRVGAIEDRASNDPAFARMLRRYTAEHVRTLRNHLVLLGRKTAAERVASFLIEMADRQPEVPDSVIELPMSRADMADYLGLTIETVCRGLTELRRQRIIAADRARIVIQNRRALEAACSDRLN
jgi:CRP/FNR family nitrogen fixation transcriptional regulator